MIAQGWKWASGVSPRTDCKVLHIHPWGTQLRVPMYWHKGCRMAKWEVQNSVDCILPLCSKGGNQNIYAYLHAHLFLSVHSYLHDKTRRMHRKTNVWPVRDGTGRDSGWSKISSCIFRVFWFLNPVKVLSNYFSTLLSSWFSISLNNLHFWRCIVICHMISFMFFCFLLDI